MIEPGRPAPLGATPDDDGTNFAVYSSVAQRVELCLFDAAGHETGRFDLHEGSDDTWHGYVPGCSAGQPYGYRVHGILDADHGLRCNPSKLLIDPYAKLLAGEFSWHKAVFDSNDLDSAPFVPRSVVCPAQEKLSGYRPRVPWSDMIFYELNVRGYTMLHPDVGERERGKFCGLTNGKILEYIKALGITSIELMPVHAFIDEHHLAKRGLRNFWGYNSISFFAPSSRYAQSDGVAEFREMVNTIHDAGLEVILDVVYNHTGEGDTDGPTISFRGIDNLAYYSTESGSPGSYINDTGTGNTINADSPCVQQLVLDSLRYWHREMGVDGFRFDLAPVLGRHNHGFSVEHPLLQAISHDDPLHDAVMVAEPWDPGPGGYQLGCFPMRWSEWNDQFRDDVRRFWRGDEGSAAAFARRLQGSAEIFEQPGRKPNASVNLVTSHDGFTLADVVSFEHRHNEANGENNEDGHAHNYSSNHGIEGSTKDASVLAIRRRQRLNFLASLFLSQGIPLLLAGDEFGNSQQGNNNAYAQDNETGWLDWSGLASDPEFLEQVRSLIQLRRDEPLLRLREYIHDAEALQWLNEGGETMSDQDWFTRQAFCAVLENRILLLINGSDEEVSFRLPGSAEWQTEFASSADFAPGNEVAALSARSLAVLLSGSN
ncbi:MAG: glycogen debranching protein GlgX [Woeseiaceae bacterium]|nr:glycogen debranching protein GlgX [Woeseiaceae bacterium]NIP21312.1 glycogen debranching protein GlgX [Woeseiaceae bacterium]NIS90279.1 glycogen debranching protein GlgX [Woeseiaceae bacterium]